MGTFNKNDDDSDKKLLDAVKHWVQFNNKEIKLFKLPDNTSYISYRCQPNDLKHEIYALFFITKSEDPLNNSLDLDYSLIENDFIDLVYDDVNKWLKRSGLDTNPKAIERALWTFIQTKLNPISCSYSFEITSSSINTDRLAINLRCTLNSEISFQSNGAINIFAINNMRVFYSHYRSRKAAPYNDLILNSLSTFGNTWLNNTSADLNRKDIHEHFAECNIGGFSAILAPFKALFDTYDLEECYRYLTITWLVHSFLLNHKQLALEIIGPVNSAKYFSDQLSRLLNGLDYIINSEVIKEDTLNEHGFNSHLLNFGNCSELPLSMQSSIVQFLDGTTFELTHLGFQYPPKVYMRRPVVWITEKPLQLIDELRQRTLTIRIKNEFSTKDMDSGLTAAILAAIFRLVIHAKKTNLHRAQRTSHDIPEPLRVFDQIGNHLSRRFFGERSTPYTEFGYQMDQYLPELRISLLSSHDFL